MEGDNNSRYFSSSGYVSDFDGSNANSGDRCGTRKVVKSECKTHKTEDGRYIRRCENTEQIFRDCIGRPTELVQSNKEYTEDDVTDQMTMGSVEPGVFSFPGLQSDIEAIERNFFGGFHNFIEAAEEMKNGIFNAFGIPQRYDSDSSSVNKRWQIPRDDHPQKEGPPKPSKSDGEVDLSGLAREV